ncbi:MAG: PepSY domain-containing protein [Rhizobiaceae bacterium]
MSRIKTTLFVGTAILALGGAPAFAQSDAKAVPPPNAMKISQIVAQVEKRDHFNYISEIDWSRDGYYEITYYTTDKAKVELKINPVTGKPE